MSEAESRSPFANDAARERYWKAHTFARGYFEPRPSAFLPKVDVHSISLNSTGWFETSFICYSCDSWDSVNTTPDFQQWVRAYNGYQFLSHVSEDTEIHKHEGYGYFKLKMGEAAQADNGKAVMVPSLDWTRPSYISADKDEKYGAPTSISGSSGLQLSTKTLFAFHGGLMAAAVMVLYPCGVIALRVGGFRSHVAFQFIASLLIAAGIFILIYAAVTNNLVSQYSVLLYFSGGLMRSHVSQFTNIPKWFLFLQPHGLLGLVLTALIPLQAFLGFAHHRKFLVTASKSKQTTFHIWIGRSVIIFGCLNVILWVLYPCQNHWSLYVITWCI